MVTLVGCIFYILHVHIINFLTQKRLDPRFSIQEVNEVDIYKFDPFQLPGLSQSSSEDQVWYFFCEPYYRNASSKNPHRARAAGAGYWKSTGHGSDIKDKSCKIVGSKRTLVFYIRKRNPGSSSKEMKTNWVMHEFYVKDSPRFKKNFVLCYIEKQPNKKPNVSSPGDGQLSPSLASDSVNHFVEDTFAEVQSQELPSHPLISDTENHVTGNTFSEVASQPIPSENWISDPKNHVGGNILPMVETEQTSTLNLVSDSSYSVAKNTFSTVKSQVLPGQNLAFDPANDVPENIVSLVEPGQPLSSHDMVSHSGNHIAESTSLLVEPQAESPDYLVSQLGNHVIENNSRRVEPQLPSSDNMAFDYRNDVVDNTMVAPQLPSSHDMNLDSRNHVAENTFCMVVKSTPDDSFQHQPMVDRQLPWNQYLVSGTGNRAAENNCSMVESSPPAEFGAFDAYNALNHSPFSAPHMPINSEQGSPSSSYSNGFSKDSTAWSSRFDGEHEDVVTSQRDFQDENPHEETEQTLLAGLHDEIIDMISNELLY